MDRYHPTQIQQGKTHFFLLSWKIFSGPKSNQAFLDHMPVYELMTVISDGLIMVSLSPRLPPQIPPPFTAGTRVQLPVKCLSGEGMLK